jgi:hypothetical protein
MQEPNIIADDGAPVELLLSLALKPTHPSHPSQKFCLQKLHPSIAVIALTDVKRNQKHAASPIWLNKVTYPAVLLSFS